MNLGMLLLIGFGVLVGVVAMRLSWRMVNKLADERPMNEDPRD